VVRAGGRHLLGATVDAGDAVHESLMGFVSKRLMVDVDRVVVVVNGTVVHRSLPGTWRTKVLDTHAQ